MLNELWSCSDIENLISEHLFFEAVQLCLYLSSCLFLTRWGTCHSPLYIIGICHGVQGRGDPKPVFVGNDRNKTNKQIKTLLLIYEHHSSAFSFFSSG